MIPRGIFFGKTYLISTSSLGETASDVVLDTQGRLYVVGSLETSRGNTNLWVRVYDSETGVVLWEETSGDNETNVVGRGIAIDGEGNMVVVGSEKERGQSKQEIVIIKYKSTD